MHIGHVTIENVRRFGSGAARVDLDLPPRGWIVIAGRNNAGKTTFLKVLALALSGQFSHEFTDTVFDWLHAGAKQARTRVTLVPSVGDGLRRDVDIFSEKAADDELVLGSEWKPQHGAMSSGRESDGNRAFAGPWHATPQGWFAVGYGAHRRLLGGASATERWASETTVESAFLTLFRDDASLLQPIRWLMDLDHRRLDPHARKAERDDARQLIQNVLRLLNDDLLGDIDALQVDSRGLLVRQGDSETSVARLGAGAQVLVALVVDLVFRMHARFGRLLFDGEKRHPVVTHDGVVLIDEVDAHLHVAWQQRIGPWLTRHFPNVQFIVTTHSPFICQAATRDGLILLPAQDSVESARVADVELYNRVVNGSVDDALLSDLFGLERTWSADAEAKRARLAALETRVLSGKAPPAEREDYKRLRDEISPSLSDDVDRAVARLAAPAATDRRP